MKAATIVAHLPKLPCSGSKRSLAVSCALEKSENQAVELFLQCAVLNRMIQVGKPVSVFVEA
jgi:hypothetical protein